MDPLLLKSWVNFSSLLGLTGMFVLQKPFLFRTTSIKVSHGWVLSGILMLLFLPQAIISTWSKIEARPWLGNDDFNQFGQIISRDQGPLLLGPVKGYADFNPQLRTGRIGHVVDRPGYLRPDSFIFTRNSVNKDLFCFSFLDWTGGVSYPEIESFYRKCWEGRNIKDWSEIRTKYGLTGIITQKTWQLKLPKITESGPLAYYQIP
jgi:hypothetical protein